jgi:hypothetical protein
MYEEASVDHHWRALRRGSGHRRNSVRRFPGRDDYVRRQGAQLVKEHGFTAGHREHGGESSLQSPRRRGCGFSFPCRSGYRRCDPRSTRALGAHFAHHRGELQG